MKMQLTSSSPMWFLFLQCFALVDVGAELSVTGLSSSFANNYIDLESESFTLGNDGAPSMVPGTEIPSSVPGTAVPVPTTLSPTDSEAPTSDFVRISMRNLARTMAPSPEDTVVPTLSPSNSFGSATVPRAIEMQENNTDTIYPTSIPTTTPSLHDPEITLAPVVTNAPTESSLPTVDFETSRIPEQTDTGGRSGVPDAGGRQGVKRASVQGQGGGVARPNTGNVVVPDIGGRQGVTDTFVRGDTSTPPRSVTDTGGRQGVQPPVDKTAVDTDNHVDREGKGTATNYHDGNAVVDADGRFGFGNHSLMIEVKYNDNPADISWALMKHPATVEVEINFDKSAIDAGKTTIFHIKELNDGKYYFRISDAGLDGGVNYRIVDTTDGGFKQIFHQMGSFHWFDYKEFYLGKQRDFYIFGYNRKVEAQTDRFYTLE